MKLHLSKSSVFTTFIVLFYLIENECYKIFDFDNAVVKYILFGGCIAFFIAFYFDMKLQHSVRIVSPFLIRYIWLMMMIIFGAQYLYTYFAYRQNITEFMKASYHFSFILLSIVILYIMYQDGGFLKLFNILTTTVSIGLAINIISSLNYNINGVLLLNVSYKMRDESIRTFGLSSMLGLVCVYTTWRFLKGNRAPKIITEMIIAWVALFYCYQSRIMEICVLMTAIYMYLRIQKKQNSRMLAYIIFTIMVVLLYQVGLFDQVMDSFAIGGQYSGSTSSRIREISYYSAEFMKNPVWGIGLMSVTTPLGRMLIRGPLGNNFPTDVGYIGALGNMGLTFGILFFILVIRWFSTVRKCSLAKTGSREEVIFLEGLLFFILISGVTLLVTSPGLIFSLPVIIAIFEWKRYELTKT